MNRNLVEQYAAGGPMVAQAIAGLTQADLLATPVPGTWSIQQIVMHLYDSDLIASDRMKRIIAEDNPPLVGYNETAFSQKLFYEALDPCVAADVFDKNRQLTAVILRKLPDSTFLRYGTHSEVGKVPLAEMVEKYVHHLEHHLKFLTHKRQLLGKPL